ncbi:MAG TPA: hypothetical protein VF988_10795, partial [Verrucomicrobiae bacterium]
PEPAPRPATSLGSSSRDSNYIRSVADLGRRAAEALDHAPFKRHWKHWLPTVPKASRASLPPGNCTGSITENL